VLDGVEGIRFCHFEDVDVVRHHLVQRIVRAYDSYGRSQQMPLELGDAGIPTAGMDGAEVPEAALKVISKPQ
jgi:phosphate starvation-inducible PhoH-like protein